MSNSSDTPQKFHFIMMFFAIIGWGLSTPFIELGLKSIPPFNFLFFRYFISSMVIIIILAFKKRNILELFKNKWIWLIGSAESTGMLLQYSGQNLGIPSGLAALLSLSFLIYVPFLALILLGQKIKIYHFFGIVLGIIGVLFITFSDNLSVIFNISEYITGSVLGILLLIGSAISYAAYIVFTSRYTTVENTNINAFDLFAAVIIIITLISMIFATIFEKIQITWSYDAWLWIILLVIFSTLIAFFAYFEALKKISANSASVLLLLQVIIPYIFDLLIEHKKYTNNVYIGMILLFMAMLIVVLGPIISKQNTNNH